MGGGSPISRPPTRAQKLADRLFRGLSKAFAALVLVLVAFIVLRIAFAAAPAMREQGFGFLSGRVWDHFTTVSMVRTIEDVLGLPHQGLTDGLAEPMADVFERKLRPWTYEARVPAVLRSTQLPVPGGHAELPRGDAAFWADATRDMNFGREDAVDSARFNRILWAGLMANAPYPDARHGKDLSRHRERLLRREAERASARPSKKVALSKAGES